MSQCEVIHSILFSDIQNRPSYTFYALWVDNISPSLNDALKFSRVILNDHDVYDSDTGEFKIPADGTYAFTANAKTYPHTRFGIPTINLEMRSEVKVTVIHKWYVTIHLSRCIHTPSVGFLTDIAQTRKRENCSQEEYVKDAMLLKKNCTIFECSVYNDLRMQYMDSYFYTNPNHIKLKQLFQSSSENRITD